MKTAVYRHWIIRGSLALILLLIAMVAALLWVDWEWLPEGLLGRLFRHQFVRSVDQLVSGQDVRWRSLQKLDLTTEAVVVPTLSFNLSTVWPEAQKLPPGFSPTQLLTNAMNPGLGVRELHRSGITGQGVKVAVIDFNLYGQHPEYAQHIVQVHRLDKTRGPSMHGPAVASLLVGKQIGTAPEAMLYYVGTPDDGSANAAYEAQALDWILEKNKRLLPAERIRVVSVSASPSGKGLWKYQKTELWEEACRRAEAEGILVIEGGGSRAFVGPCVLDPADPEHPAKCKPVPAEGKKDFFAGRLLVPIGPRTVAEEYYAGDEGYRYCGPLNATWLDAGISWAIPYAAGVLALGWQVCPNLSAPVMKELLFGSAYVLPDGSRIIDPQAFIELVKNKVIENLPHH